MFAYNSTVSRTTGYSPNELTFSRKPCFPIDLVLNLKRNQIECKGKIRGYIKRLRKHRQIIFEEANLTQDDYDARRKKYYDRDKQAATFKAGDYVTLFDGDRRKGKKRKFNPKWVGFWIITQMYGQNACQIQELDLGTIKKVHVSKLKLIRWSIDQTL